VEETESEWQLQVRARAREQAATSSGMMVRVVAHFGFTANGSSDDGRERTILTPISPTYAAEILRLQEAGATESELHPVVAEAITESYFTEWGTRAKGLRADLKGVAERRSRQDPATHGKVNCPIVRRFPPSWRRLRSPFCKIGLPSATPFKGCPATQSCWHDGVHDRIPKGRCRVDGPAGSAPTTDMARVPGAIRRQVGSTGFQLAPAWRYIESRGSQPTTTCTPAPQTER
jgi:hypothetical protein